MIILKRLRYLFLLIKKTLFIGINVYFYDETFLKVGLISSLNMTNAVYSFIKKPYSLKGDHTKGTSWELLVLFNQYGRVCCTDIFSQ